MGTGYELKCKACGNRKMLLVGHGFRRQDYQTLIDRMKAGEFGEEIQQFVLKHKPNRIKDGNCIYYCENCTQAHTMPDLTMIFYTKVKESQAKDEEPKKEQDESQKEELYEILKMDTDGHSNEEKKRIPVCEISVRAPIKCSQCGVEMKKYTDPRAFMNVVRDVDFVCEKCKKGVYHWSGLMFWD